MMIIQNINFCFIYFTVKFRQVGVSSWPGAKDKSASKRDTTNERNYRESGRECCARESGREVRACIEFITIRFSFIYKHRGTGKEKIKHAHVSCQITRRHFLHRTRSVATTSPQMVANICRKPYK